MYILNHLVTKCICSEDSNVVSKSDTVFNLFKYDLKFTKLILCIGLYSYCMQSMHLFLTVAFKAMCRLPTKMAVRKPVHKDAYLLTKFYHMATVICLGSYRISFLMLWMANLIYCIVQSKQTVCTTWAQEQADLAIV